MMVREAVADGLLTRGYRLCCRVRRAGLTGVPDRSYASRRPYASGVQTASMDLTGGSLTGKFG
jgi:hypothetical protein